MRNTRHHIYKGFILILIKDTKEFFVIQRFTCYFILASLYLVKTRVAIVPSFGT